jgi:hypothetical protein
LVLGEREIVAVARVEPRLNPLTADAAAWNGAIRRFQNALDLLGPGERVQIVLECLRSGPESCLKGMDERESPEAPDAYRGWYRGLLRTWIGGYFEASFVPRFHHHVLYSWEPTEAWPSDGTLDEVRRRSGEFFRALEGPDLACVRLSAAEISELLDRCANPSRSCPLPADAWTGALPEVPGEASFEELLFRSSVSDEVEGARRRHAYLQVGRSLVRVSGFLRAPSGASLRSRMAELLLAGREFRWSVHIRGMSQEKAVAAVQKRRAAALGAVTFGGGKATQAAEEQAAAFDALVRAHARKELRFVVWSAYLGVWAQKEEELQRRSSELDGIFSGLVPEEGVYRQWEHWLSTLPLCQDSSGNGLLAQSDAVSETFPFYDFSGGSLEGGALVGFGPANQPCLFDPWSRSVTNGNVFVTGQAGSGKSFLINLILNRLGAWGMDVSVIDRAKSYRNTCRALGGDYLELTLEGAHSVNIWDVMDHDPDLESDGLNDLAPSGETLPAKIEQVVGLLEIVLGESGGALPRLQRSLLQDDVAETYRRCLRVETGEFGASAAPESIPRFSDLADTLAARSAGDREFSRERRELLQKLGPVVSGSLRNLLNRPSTLAASGRVRAFDLSGLPEEATVQGAAVYVLTAWLYRHWRRNKVLGRRQIVVFDEIRSFMGFQAGRSLLDALARRSRHMGLMPFFATQQLGDVLEHPETRAILDNCQTQFLFAQSRSVAERIGRLLELNEQELARIQSLTQVRGAYSNAFFVHGTSRNILTVRPDPATRWLNTTEPTYDLPRLERALKESGGDIWEAIRELVASDLERSGPHA